MKELILVIGGAGFIGSHLCHYLVINGKNVCCIDNLITGNEDNIKDLESFDTFDFVQVNAQDLDNDIATNIGRYKINAIYYLASIASPKLYLQYPMQSIDCNIIGLLKCLDLAASHGAKFLYTSTSEVYGDPLEHPQKESYSGNVNPICERSIYDELKRAGETLVMAYNRQGLNTKIVRIFNTYGSNMSNDGRVIPSFINSVLQNKPLAIYGNGHQTRSFCYISDLIHGINAVMASDYHLPLNLGNPYCYYSIMQTARVIQKIMGSNLPFEFSPICEGDPKIRKPDISKVHELTGWKPKIDFETGLKYTIEYFRNKYVDSAT